MNNNPYTRLIEVMQDEGARNNPPSIVLGEVVSGFPNPIIRFGSLQLDKDFFYINEVLVNNLGYGDKVVAIPTADRQIYVVLAKVVRP